MFTITNIVTYCSKILNLKATDVQLILVKWLNGFSLRNEVHALFSITLKQILPDPNIFFLFQPGLEHLLLLFDIKLPLLLQESSPPIISSVVGDQTIL